MSLDQLAMISQIAGAVIFVIVAIWMFNKWVKPAVITYQATKNAELAENEARREQMKAAVAAAQAEIDTAQSDAAEIRSRATDVAERERAHALDEARAEAARIVRNAEDELGRARMAARDRLRIEFIEKALVKARAEATRRIDGPIERRLVEATVDDVVQRPL
jgi:F0F1-type ATP synthase membrane subunit b/b'